MTAGLFASTTGPHNAKIVICGEAWGEQEALTKLPFQGKAGQELKRMLDEAGIAKAECLCTNVFNSRPPDNKIEAYFVKKDLAGRGAELSPIRMGAYIHESHLPELERLSKQLSAVRPNLVIALGNTACWAILGFSKITAIRGTARTDSRGIKVIPTYHPSAVLRNWSLRPIVIADLLKCARESNFPEIRRPQRRVLVNPTLEELRAYVRAEHPILSVDIETSHGTITEIGFASSPSYALVVPFTSKHADGSFWQSETDELCAWELIKHLLERPMPKLFQNGMYDLQYITKMGIRPKNCTADTMLLHHSLYPEMMKGLGFLASVYTDENVAWKTMRTERPDTVKANE